MRTMHILQFSFDEINLARRVCSYITEEHSSKAGTATRTATGKNINKETRAVRLPTTYPVGGVETGGAAADDADMERLAGGGGEPPLQPGGLQQQPTRAGEELQPAGHLGTAERGGAANLPTSEGDGA